MKFQIPFCVAGYTLYTLSEAVPQGRHHRSGSNSPFSTVTHAALAPAIHAAIPPEASGFIASLAGSPNSGVYGKPSSADTTSQPLISIQSYGKDRPTRTSTRSRPSPSPPTSLPTPSSGRVKFGGVNMAGFDFGCSIDGTCKLGGQVDIVSNGNALAQMNHFTSTGGLNTFRLPVGWQFLINSATAGSQLDAGNAAKYDALVRGCLDSGAAMCIVDLHNYARFDNAIVGQGGPSTQMFAALWAQIAGNYAGEPRVAFDIMNEPHDLDINTWASTLQAAVSAIRGAGATQNMILLSGDGFASAASFVDSGSALALSGIRNPDGTTAGLVYNVHKYLDASGSGTSSECATDNVEGVFSPLAEYLRGVGRQAMVTETGGGPNATSCMQLLCQQMDFLNANSDVFLGVVTWAAGGFDQAYEISATPIQNGNVLVDVPLVQQCVVGKLGKGYGVARYRGPPLA